MKLVDIANASNQMQTQLADFTKLAMAVQDTILPLQMPDMSAYKVPETKTITTNNMDVQFNITINGNATQDTVSQFKEIAESLVNNRRFQENVTKFVSQRQAADGRMAGKRTSVK